MATNNACNQSSTGFQALNSSGAFLGRTFTAPSAGFTIANGSGVSGDPTITLANDLAVIEALTTFGFATRTATNTWTTRTITGTAGQITVSDGDGIAADPILGIDSSVLTSGTFTPIVSGSSTAGNGTYTIQVGSWQKFVNVVWVYARVVWTNHDGTGNMLLDNLPFNSSSVSNYTQFLPFSTDVATATPFTNPVVWGELNLGTANLTPVSYDKTTGGVVAQALTTTGELIFRGSYEV